MSSFKESVDSLVKEVGIPIVSVNKSSDLDPDLLKVASVIDTDEEYFSCPYYSASLLKEYHKKPSLPFSKTFNQGEYERKQTKSKKLGSIIHKVILEGHKVREFAPLLTPKEKEYVPLILKNLSKNNIVLNILKDAKEREWAITWTEEIRDKKLQCKAKVDLLTRSHFLFEIKTCSELEEIERQIDKYRYDLQLSFYKRGIELTAGKDVPTCGIIALETSPPYENHIFQLDKSYLDRGENGGYINRKECVGWRELLTEIHFEPRKRFKERITVLTL